jgi:hypothetical protein
VAVGDLTGDGRPEAAVLLSCSPQPSNFYVEEVHAFEDGPKLLGYARSDVASELPVR